VFKSTNGGGSWAAVNTGLPAGPGVPQVAIDPITPTTLYAGTNGIVFKSTNSGGMWGASGRGVPAEVFVLRLAIDPRTPTTIYAATWGGGVFKSTDGAATWHVTGLVGEAICGDGVVACGEQCEDGNLVNGDGCDANCTPSACGNGAVSPSEECDDGNQVNGDGCDANCTLPRCGNGIGSAGEECDDGNRVDGDGCDSNCTVTRCGNGVVTAGEQCDDGTLNPFDGCDANCSFSACGDGIVTPPEECDDGNTNPRDGCTNACTICGNGIVTAPEGCDDGNRVNGDGCEDYCAQLGCGNALVEGDEDCDDGGLCVGGANAGTFCTAQQQCPGGECQTVGGDGCATNCTLERAVTVSLEPGGLAGWQLRSGTSGVQVQMSLWTWTIPMPFPAAALTLRAGRARRTSGSDDIPLAVRATDLRIEPISFAGGCLCIEGLADPTRGEGVAGTGSVTCAGTRSGVDLTTTIDHSTNDTDPQCTAGTVEGEGRCEYAMCTDGSSPGSACRWDDDCGGPHAGVCNGPPVLRAAGRGPTGSTRLDLRLLTRHFAATCAVETSSKLCVASANAGAGCSSDDHCPGGRCVPAKGPDGVPCTSDDPVPGGVGVVCGLMCNDATFLPLAVDVALTTGTATTEILDVDDQSGERLTAQATGHPVSCEALEQGGVVGTLVGAVPWLHTFGDSVATFILAASHCGNGQLDAEEDCDTGGESTTCDADCTLAVCGDGTRNRTAGEECDDGNRNDNDECRNDCKPNVCGDGVIRTGAAQCDDGNTTDGDGCDSNCTVTACGNGVRTAGEACDDGNLASGDGCSDQCRSEFCGDRVVQAGLGEQCDDGGFIDGDGCDSNCTVTACGNGIRTASEECDDQNTTAGDCCSSACRVEAAGAPCFDGNVCDGTGSCDGSGSCQPEAGTPLDCDDGKPQTFDFCDALHGCRQCTGECNGDGYVTVDELLTMVRIALGTAPVSECPAGDGDQDGTITIGEIVAAVNVALDGCGGG